MEERAAEPGVNCPAACCSAGGQYGSASSFKDTEMRRASLISVMIFTLAGALPAAATGTLDCVADDATAQVDVHGVVPYGMGAPLLQAQAEIAVELPGVGADLGNVVFGAEHQVQYWLDEVSLNVLFYWERAGNGPFGSTTLVIKTTRNKGDEEGAYAGGYDIEGYEVPAEGGDPIIVHARGQIECSAG